MGLVLSWWNRFLLPDCITNTLLHLYVNTKNNWKFHNMLHFLHEELCPHITWSKVTERVQTIKVQLKREIVSLPTWNVPCKNTDATKFVVDNCEGSHICLGSDGLGFGCVVLERALKQSYMHQEDFIDPCELHSEQQAFSSEWK